MFRHGAGLLLLAFMFLLQACSSTPVDVGRGSILGEGGMRSTRSVLQREPKLADGVSAYFRSTASTAAEKAETREVIQKSIAADFADTLAACNRVFSGFENQANKFRWTSFGIAMVGTVAGAVIVPSLAASGAEANKAAIAAWGGLSGAANSAQNILGQQGLSAQESVKTREQIRGKFDSALSDYFTATDDDARIKALQKAAVACVSYAIQSPSSDITGGAN